MTRRGWIRVTVIVGAVGAMLWQAKEHWRSAAGNSETPAAGTLAITSLVPDRIDVPVGGTIEITAHVRRAADRHGRLRYTWIASRGTIVGDGTNAVWAPPAKPGNYELGLTVSDDDGRAIATVKVGTFLRPHSLPNVRLRSRPAVSPIALAQRKAVDAKIAALRVTAKRRDSFPDRLRAQIALENIAALLLQDQRYEDALKTYGELLIGVSGTSARYAKYRHGFAVACFFLGHDDAALAGFADSGSHAGGMSHYYRGELLERKGNTDEAIKAYSVAHARHKRFGDSTLRLALLRHERGDDSADVRRLLTTAADRIGQARLRNRLDTDHDLLALRALYDGVRTNKP